MAKQRQRLTDAQLEAERLRGSAVLLEKTLETVRGERDKYFHLARGLTGA